MLYDAFISHASEDKDAFVRPLAIRLKELNVETWYDEFTLKPGDSLRRSIDKGLSKSRIGIVVLSRNFFLKEWPQWELDGLVQRQNEERRKLIIPIWYHVDKADILKYSPPLADKVAIVFKGNIEEISQKLFAAIHPQGSTLVEARDCLLSWGYDPPVVTDDWWLDLVEYSGTDYRLEQWGFQQIARDRSADANGERLAKVSIIREWQGYALDSGVCQVTKPERLLEDIAQRPKLADIMRQDPRALACFAPQLTIPSLGGPFETLFDKYLDASVEEYNRKNESRSSKVKVLCEEEIALRHPTFGNYSAATIACQYTQGPLMGHTSRMFETIDYIAWILSEDSGWLPPTIRSFLTEGYSKWAAWDSDSLRGRVPDHKLGALVELYHAAPNYVPSKKLLEYLEARFEISRQELGLSDKVERIVEQFVAGGFVKDFINRSENYKRINA